MTPRNTVIHHALLICASLSLASPTALFAANAAPGSAIELLNITPDFAQQSNKAQSLDLLEIAPLHLPPLHLPPLHLPPTSSPPTSFPPASAGDCNHYGWPVATMTGDTLIVMHRRIPGHKAKGAGNPDPSMSYGIVLRSEDGGQTWSKPYDLRDCMKPEDRLRGGIVPLSHRAKFDQTNKSDKGYKVHLHSIGTARDGGVIAINNHGVFRSDDAGRTWRHFSNALREDNFPPRNHQSRPAHSGSPEARLARIRQLVR